MKKDNIAGFFNEMSQEMNANNITVDFAFEAIKNDGTELWRKFETAIRRNVETKEIERREAETQASILLELT